MVGTRTPASCSVWTRSAPKESTSGANKTGGRLPSNEPKLQAHPVTSLRLDSHQPYPHFNMRAKSQPTKQPPEGGMIQVRVGYTVEDNITTCTSLFGHCFVRLSSNTSWRDLDPTILTSVLEGYCRLPPPAAFGDLQVNSTVDIAEAEFTPVATLVDVCGPTTRQRSKKSPSQAFFFLPCRARHDSSDGRSRLHTIRTQFKRNKRSRPWGKQTKQATKQQNTTPKPNKKPQTRQPAKPSPKIEITQVKRWNVAN